MLGIAVWPTPPFWRTVPLARRASRAAGGGGGRGGGVCVCVCVGGGGLRPLKMAGGTFCLPK